MPKSWISYPGRDILNVRSRSRDEKKSYIQAPFLHAWDDNLQSAPASLVQYVDLCNIMRRGTIDQIFTYFVNEEKFYLG